MRRRRAKKDDFAPNATLKSLDLFFSNNRRRSRRFGVQLRKTVGGRPPRTATLELTQRENGSLFVIFVRFDTNDLIGTGYVARCIRAAQALRTWHREGEPFTAMREAWELELDIQAEVATGKIRREGDSRFITGYLDEQFRKGRRPTYGYPRSELPKFPGATMEMVPSIIAASRGYNRKTG